MENASESVYLDAAGAWYFCGQHARYLSSRNCTRYGIYRCCQQCDWDILPWENGAKVHELILVANKFLANCTARFTHNR